MKNGRANKTIVVHIRLPIDIVTKAGKLAAALDRPRAWLFAQTIKDGIQGHAAAIIAKARKR